MTSNPLEIQSELPALLSAHVASLEDSAFDELWDRFTEEHMSWFRRATKVRAKRFESSKRVQGKGGRSFDLEEWAAIETPTRLHIFVSIWSIDQPDIEVNDDIIVQKAKQSLDFPRPSGHS